MKKTKVIINNRNARGMYVGYTWFQVVVFKIKRFFRRAFRLALVVCAIWGIAAAYRYVHPKVVVAEVAKEVTVDPAYPILEKIATAESYNSHYCTSALVAKKACRKSEIGQVLVRANKDAHSSIDVGRYQINLYYWGAKAAELGYNLFDENENREMAFWIYRNYGTEPWYSSEAKWKN